MIGATIYTYLSGNIRESNNKIRFFGTKFQNVPFFLGFWTICSRHWHHLVFYYQAGLTENSGQGSQKTSGRAHRKRRAALTETSGQGLKRQGSPCVESFAFLGFRETHASAPPSCTVFSFLRKTPLFLLDNSRQNAGKISGHKKV
jgi:hypothetical protein